MKEYVIAKEIYSLFDWGNTIKAISFDKEAGEILVDEQQLMRIIQMVNPMQPPRKIRLVKGEEVMLYESRSF